MAMKSLSRKLQNFANWVELILNFWHWVLLPTVIGWPQLSVAPGPEPTTLHAFMPILDRPRPVGELNRLEK